MSETIKSTNVLHVLSSFNPGGVETWILNLQSTTVPDKIRIHACLTHPEKKPGKLANIFTENDGSIHFCCLKPYQFPIFCVRFVRVCRRNKINVVHSHVHHFSGVILFLAYLAGIRTRIAHSHNDLRDIHSKQSILRRMYLRLCKCMISLFSTHKISCSEKAAASLFNCKKNEKVIKIRYGLPLKQIARQSNQDARATYRSLVNASEGTIIIGHVGRFVPQKNHAFILGVASELEKRKAAYRLVLVGDGPERTNLERLARERDLASENLFFLGERQDVLSIMANLFDVFLFPSTHEGLGIVLLEAQACGVPCVFSDAVPNEAVVNPRICRCLSLDDPFSLWADSCILAAQSPPSKDDATESLHQISIDSNWRQLESIYREQHN